MTDAERDYWFRIIMKKLTGEAPDLREDAFTERDRYTPWKDRPGAYHVDG